MKWTISSCLLVFSCFAQAQCESPTLDSLESVSYDSFWLKSCGSSGLIDKGIWPFNSYRPITITRVESRPKFFSRSERNWEYSYLDKNQEGSTAPDNVFLPIAGVKLDAFNHQTTVVSCRDTLIAGDVITLSNVFGRTYAFLVNSLYANPSRTVVAAVKPVGGAKTRYVDLTNVQFSVTGSNCPPK